MCSLDCGMAAVKQPAWVLKQAFSAVHGMAAGVQPASQPSWLWHGRRGAASLVAIVALSRQYITWPPEGRRPPTSLTIYGMATIEQSATKIPDWLWHGRREAASLVANAAPQARSWHGRRGAASLEQS